MFVPGEKTNGNRDLHGVKARLRLLDEIEDYELTNEQGLKRKLALMKEIILLLADELEALEFVRSINISRGVDMHEEMRRFEVHLVQSALERTGGHLTNAAKLLGINLTTLHNKIKRLNISTDILVDAPILHEDQRPTPHNNGNRIGPAVNGLVP